MTQRRSQPYRRKQSIGRGTLREKLVKIGAKLGIPFWDYLGGRLKGPDGDSKRASISLASEELTTRKEKGHPTSP